MLAQNFKSAANLEITEAQKDALVKTLVLLETGKLTHVPVTDDDEYDPPEVAAKFTGNFNMRFWTGEERHCGTVACIGGTAELIGDTSFLGWCTNPGLSDLFMPHSMSFEQLQNVTTEQAARALRNYLTTGGPQWDSALS